MKTTTLEKAIERRTFGQARFRFWHPTTEEVTKDLLRYLTKESFSGSFPFNENAQTYQICKSFGEPDSLLCQDWNCTVFEAVVDGVAGNCITVCDDIEEFVTQWYGFGNIRKALRKWVENQNPRDEWDSEEYTCQVWVCDNADWYEAVESAKATLRDQAKEEFEKEWEWATSSDATDPEILYSEAYDKASEGRSRFFMPREGEIHFALSDLVEGARKKREALISEGYEDALSDYLEKLNLEN